MKQECQGGGSLPVANVLDVLWDGGVGADPMPIHQGDQFALLNNNEPKFTVGKSVRCQKKLTVIIKAHSLQNV
jgi:hypothetical protein